MSYICFVYICLRILVSSTYRGVYLVCFSSSCVPCVLPVCLDCRLLNDLLNSLTFIQVKGYIARFDIGASVDHHC